MSITSIDAVRRNARVSTRSIAADLVQVSTPDRVLGHIRVENGSHVALRGANPHWGDEVGRYATQGMALEALRLRKRSV
ncbi:hypothetical protein SOM11_00245 [Frigoribacterium sp. CFBP9039]|uniref:hypothetical protein n=1 Tax=Frigoribacterium TaxID=96492 RepID=UPI001782A2D1|nr:MULTISPECIES: hypothetical protein [Frigoribacterium]MBD8702430.1 hypothetical protein [Frigoribacterium sp. CFBP 13712]MCJ0699709.1 hypothetical protein [Frigoribacterium faeni]MDY0891284.1 hypothetical protein [Frigoribacterium sp. CFBP9030]MDY0944415.1 hypothetical protein [Frigoribacterium sp. CFBP9039]